MRALRLLAAGAVLLLVLGVGTFVYRRGFDSGRDHTAARDSRQLKKWVSPRWRYEVTFPPGWEPVKRGDGSVQSPGVDVFCASGRSASTAVFAYPRLPADTLDGFAKEILERHRQEFKNLEMISEKSYDAGGLSYKKMVFKVKSPVSTLVYHYAVIFGPEAVLAVSSNALEQEYAWAEPSFEGIVQSLRFLPKEGS